MRLDEFSLIGQIRKDFPAAEGTKGIGDDCAIISQKDGMETLISTDMLIEGVHFLIDRISPFDLGWKSAAVNISDIAAMGGTPKATFLSIALPKNMSQNWIDDFLKGYHNISERYGVSLLGGDTTSSLNGVCINVTIQGECPKGKALTRSGARPGDLICVSGTLGDSAAGLKCLLSDDKDWPELLQKHYRPEPRINEGLALSKMPGIGAAMDISDGIASDLRHILEESRVGAEVELSRIPISESLLKICRANDWDPYELALCGGEDYELLFTCRPDSIIPIPHHQIGRITEGSSLKWIGSNKEYKGFSHF